MTTALRDTDLLSLLDLDPAGFAALQQVERARFWVPGVRLPLVASWHDDVLYGRLDPPGAMRPIGVALAPAERYEATPAVIDTLCNLTGSCTFPTLRPGLLGLVSDRAVVWHAGTGLPLAGNVLAGALAEAARKVASPYLWVGDDVFAALDPLSVRVPGDYRIRLVGPLLVHCYGGQAPDEILVENRPEHETTFGSYRTFYTPTDDLATLALYRQLRGALLDPATCLEVVHLLGLESHEADADLALGAIRTT